VGVGLDMSTLHSPGGVADRLLARMGVPPPLAQGHLSDDEYDLWMRTSHGGWITDGPFDGMVIPAVDADIRSAYAAVAVLLGWWSYWVARTVRSVDVTAAFRHFICAPDLRAGMCDPRTWRRWGFTRVLIRAHGEIVPISPWGPHGTSLRMGPTWCDELHVAWLDAVGATVLAGRPVEVVEAVHLDPQGCIEGLRPVYAAGHVLDPASDPAAALVRLRRATAAAGRTREADALRVVGSSMVYGNAAREDGDPNGVGRPGPWNFPPLAACVTAGSRAVLAIIEAEASERHSALAARDTDGVTFLASPLGGDLDLGDRGHHHVLSWAEVDEILRPFDALDPFRDGSPFWDVKREDEGQPLRTVVWGSKRYDFFTGGSR